MRSSLSLTLAIILTLFLVSCGRKAPPRLPDYEQPMAPSSLTAIHRGNSVMLAWDYPRSKHRRIKEFRVVRDGKAVATTDETTYNDSDIKTGKAYDYTVFAVGKNGTISEGTARINVETVEVPEAPTDVVAEVVEEGVRLLWSHSQRDVFFNVYRSPERALSPILPANPEPISGNTYTDIPYMDKPVFYTVRALVGSPVRHEGDASDAVELKPDVFVPSPPSDLRATLAGDKVLLAWKDNPEVWVGAYAVYKSSDGREFYLIGESRTPSFIDSEEIEGNVYYKVKAVGPEVEGAFSEPVAVTVK